MATIETEKQLIMHSSHGNRNNVLIRIILVVVAIVTLVYGAGTLIYQNEKYQSEQEKNTNPDFEVVKTGKKVLFLSSYSPTFPSLPNETKGIEKVLNERGYELDIEYMDTVNNNQEEDRELFEKTLQRKMINNGPFSGVVAGDDAALTFVLDHPDMFSGLPKVFIGVNSLALAQKACRDPLITGETEKMYLDETLQVAEKLNPDSDHQIVYITDNTSTGQADTEMMNSFLDKHHDWHAEMINASLLTRNELGEELKKIDKKAIVLYLSCAKDIDGNTYGVASSSEYIAEHTDIPVFRSTGGGFGGGITGGMVMDFEKSAEKMTRVLTDAMEGNKKISSVPLSTDSKGQLIFDAKAMKRFGISRHQLPADTVYQNENRSAFNINRQAAGPLNLMILSLLVLIAVMIWTSLEERNYANKVSYASSHDELTGLVNRQSALPYLKTYTKKHWPFSFLLMDIDDMKSINNAYGHGTGDALLIRIANALKAYAEEKDGCICQYGGDEFLLAVPGDDMNQDSVEIKDVFAIIRRCGSEGEHPLNVAASMGVRSTGVKKRDVQEYLDDAEIAMMNAKHRGKQMAVLYEESMRKEIASQNEVRRMLGEALDHDGFYMVYQPKVRPSDCQIDSFEALVRMKGAKTSPQIFIGIAEECGWIRKIGRIITEKTIQQLAEWRDAGYPLVPVSINYSVGQMSDPGYLEFLMEKLDEYQIEPKYIQIEITESLYLTNAGDSLKLLSSLNGLGIRVLLDDFGSGYANFEYLNYIPADIIKLDKTLIDTYLNPEKKDTISYLITISHNLKKEVVAEGVETKEQYLMLKKMDCDYIQGYYFSRPVEAQEAVHLDFADKA